MARSAPPRQQVSQEDNDYAVALKALNDPDKAHKLTPQQKSLLMKRGNPDIRQRIMAMQEEQRSEQRAQEARARAQAEQLEQQAKAQALAAPYRYKFTAERGTRDGVTEEQVKASQQKSAEIHKLQLDTGLVTVPVERRQSTYDPFTNKNHREIGAGRERRLEKDGRTEAQIETVKYQKLLAKTVTKDLTHMFAKGSDRSDVIRAITAKAMKMANDKDFGKTAPGDMSPTDAVAYEYAKVIVQNREASRSGAEASTADMSGVLKGIRSESFKNEVSTPEQQQAAAQASQSRQAGPELARQMTMNQP